MARRSALVGAGLVGSAASSSALLGLAAARGWAAGPDGTVRPPFIEVDIGSDVGRTASPTVPTVLGGANVRAALFRIAATTAAIVRGGAIPIVVGGDCSVLPAALAGVLDGNSSRDRLGLLSFDAYAEFHTPASSTSRDFAGMAFAACVGHGDLAFTRLARDRFPLVEEADAVRIGTRSIDDGERSLKARSRVTWIPWSPGPLGPTVASLSTAMGVRAARIRSWVVHLSASALDRTQFTGTAMDAGPGGFRTEEIDRLSDTARASIDSAQGSIVGGVLAGFAPDGELARREFERRLEALVRLVEGRP
ncbi:MAG TPA: arginase family protein [Thermoplasmata archaeon]|nr:arginase family protein [Thermoplasmata archaeon]